MQAVAEMRPEIGSVPVPVLGMGLQGALPDCARGVMQ